MWRKIVQLENPIRFDSGARGLPREEKTAD